MHELSIMKHLLDTAIEAARRDLPDGRITKVCVRVGSLSGVVSESLEFAFEALTPDTIATGAVLQVEEAQPRLYCPGCRVEFTSPVGDYRCPGCSGRDGELRGGNEIILQHIEVEENVR